VPMTTRLPSGELVPTADRIWADPAQDDCGGAGVYSSPSDYLKILTSLLCDDGKLLTSDSVDELFKLQLPDAKYLKEVLADPESNRSMSGGLPFGTDVNYGLGGLIIMEDIPTGRREGAIAWNGLPNLFWWIDRKEGLCGLYASQVIPEADVESINLNRDFETKMYRLAQAKPLL